MSATSQASQAIHVGSLAELPLEHVSGIYDYAMRTWATIPINHADEPYYWRMQELALKELQRRATRAHLKVIK